MTWMVPLRRGDVGLDDLRRPVEEHVPAADADPDRGAGERLRRPQLHDARSGDVALDDVVEQHAPERGPVGGELVERRLRDGLEGGVRGREDRQRARSPRARRRGRPSSRGSAACRTALRCAAVLTMFCSAVGAAVAGAAGESQRERRLRPVAPAAPAMPTVLLEIACELGMVCLLCRRGGMRALRRAPHHAVTTRGSRLQRRRIACCWAIWYTAAMPTSPYTTRLAAFISPNSSPTSVGDQVELRHRDETPVDTADGQRAPRRRCPASSRASSLYECL